MAGRQPIKPYAEGTAPWVKVQCPVPLLPGLQVKVRPPAALNGIWNWLEKNLTLLTVPEAAYAADPRRHLPQKVLAKTSRADKPLHRSQT